jgi:HPt (histidine-containing phosphotransfer) domain-containing protein
MGRLVNITVDNPKYHVAPSSPTIPHLVPISASVLESASAAHNDEQTMLWRNVATLFNRCEQNDAEIQKQREDYDPCIGELNRVTDDLYQETRDLKCRISEVSAELLDELDSKLRQMKKQTRKYVSKKVNKTKQTASGAAFDADMEVFKYVDTIREEFVDTNSQLKEELLTLRQEIHEEISELNDTYYRDYRMFIKREEDLMSKLDAALKMNEATNQRMKDMEDFFMTQIQQARNYADTHVAGDLREEFSTAICREVAFESKVSAELVQGVHNELTDVITRSNEYHSHRYFETVEDVKQLRETCQTLKQSIGMVDAELSDTKEIVEYLKDEVGEATNTVDEMTYTVAEMNTAILKQKDDIYDEMDSDYYDMKDYVKRRIQRHVRHSHERTPSASPAPCAEHTDAISMIVSEYGEAADTSAAATAEDDGNVIIMDDTCMISDDDE